MLAALVPTAVVFPTIRPYEEAMALAFIFYIASNILSAVIPSKVAITVLLIIFPLTRILSTINPDINAVALHFVSAKVA